MWPHRKHLFCSALPLVCLISLGRRRACSGCPAQALTLTTQHFWEVVIPSAAEPRTLASSLTPVSISPHIRFKPKFSQSVFKMTAESVSFTQHHHCPQLSQHHLAPASLGGSLVLCLFTSSYSDPLFRSKATGGQSLFQILFLLQASHLIQNRVLPKTLHDHTPGHLSGLLFNRHFLFSLYSSKKASLTCSKVWGTVSAERLLWCSPVRNFLVAHSNVLHPSLTRCHRTVLPDPYLAVRELTAPLSSFSFCPWCCLLLDVFARLSGMSVPWEQKLSLVQHCISRAWHGCWTMEGVQHWLHKKSDSLSYCMTLN